MLITVYTDIEGRIFFPIKKSIFGLWKCVNITDKKIYFANIDNHDKYKPIYNYSNKTIRRIESLLYEVEQKFKCKISDSDKYDLLKEIYYRYINNDVTRFRASNNYTFGVVNITLYYCEYYHDSQVIKKISVKVNHNENVKDCDDIYESIY